MADMKISMTLNHHNICKAIQPDAAMMGYLGTNEELELASTFVIN